MMWSLLLSLILSFPAVAESEKVAMGEPKATESESIPEQKTPDLTTEDLPAPVMEWYRNHLESQIAATEKVRVEKTEEPSGEVRYHLVREQDDGVLVFSFDDEGDLKQLSRR